jgi:hypothetical protein
MDLVLLNLAGGILNAFCYFSSDKKRTINKMNGIMAIVGFGLAVWCSTWAIGR